MDDDAPLLSPDGLILDGLGPPMRDDSPPPAVPPSFVTANPAVRFSTSDADLARKEGWTVGTILDGEDENGTDRIVITAIGETKVLAKLTASKLKTERTWVNANRTQGMERMWTFGFRTWRKV
jgi:hypothetical protein